MAVLHFKTGGGAAFFYISIIVIYIISLIINVINSNNKAIRMEETLKACSTGLDNPSCIKAQSDYGINCSSSLIEVRCEWK